MEDFPLYQKPYPESNYSSPREPQWLPLEGRTQKDWISIEELEKPTFDLEDDVDFPGLDDLDQEEAHAEKLAWYRSHHSTPRLWGIYIREYGIGLYASHILEGLWQKYGIKGSESADPDFSSPPPHEVPKQDLYRGAYDLALQRLLTHEWFHHQVEYLAYHLENVVEEELYPQYKENVYQVMYPDKHCLEEALANASVARSTRCENLLSEAVSNADNHLSSLTWRSLLDEIVRAPPAYEAYRKHTSDSNFSESCEVLATQIRIGDDALWQRAVQNGETIRFAKRHFPFEYADDARNPSNRVPIQILPLESDTKLE